MEGAGGPLSWRKKRVWAALLKKYLDGADSRAPGKAPLECLTGSSRTSERHQCVERRPATCYSSFGCKNAIITTSISEKANEEEKRRARARASTSQR